MVFEEGRLKLFHIKYNKKTSLHVTPMSFSKGPILNKFNLTDDFYQYVNPILFLEKCVLLHTALESSPL